MEPQGPKPPPLPEPKRVLRRDTPALDQRPEPEAVRLPRAEPVQRKVTLPGMPSVAVPRQSGEFAPTLPAPVNPSLRKTWRLPTPPSALKLARRTDPPPPDDPSPTEGPSSGRAGDREAILDGELAKARATIAELEREARVQFEAKGPGPYQKPIESIPAPSPARRSTSVPPKSGDWQKLGFKVVTAIVAALLPVIAALGYWAVTATTAKTEAIKAAQEAKTKADSRDGQWKQWASVVTWIQDCRNGQQLDVNEMLLPAPDKMGSARKPEPWIVKCPKALPPPP